MYIFNSERSPENRRNLVESKRDYKRYERQVRRKYLRSEGDRLSVLRKSNPRQFYKAFKKDSRSPPTDLVLNDFFEHFKFVCNNDVYNTVADTDRSVSCIFDELDAPISCDEVSKILKKAKPGKSPGIDNLLNEYFSKFSSTFVPILSRLFNVIHFLNAGLKE